MNKPCLAPLYLHNRYYNTSIGKYDAAWSASTLLKVASNIANCLIMYRRSDPTLIKKKIKFSPFIRKFKLEQLQSHIWLTASSYIGKYLRISSYIRKPFLIYYFATAPTEFLYIWGKFDFLFYQCKGLPLSVGAPSSVPGIQTHILLGKKRPNQRPS